MSQSRTGTLKKSLFSGNPYLAPLPIPTGEKPSDSMNIIWRKNDAFIDIGNYSIGSAVVLIWTLSILFASIAYFFSDPDALILGACMVTFPTFLVVRGLLRPTPLPVRFNRQRREVCVVISPGEYWIVPWESVIAASSEHSALGRAGKMTKGMLFVGIENPDPKAEEHRKHYTFAFNCGGGQSAMKLWECVRSYMEIGPAAVPDSRVGNTSYENSQIGSTLIDLRKGNVLGVFWGVFCITILGMYLAEKLQNLKLSNPPEPNFPDIIEWSKPLPPEQWAKRSPELEAAIARHEWGLAANKGRESAR